MMLQCERQGVGKAARPLQSIKQSRAPECGGFETDRPNSQATCQGIDRRSRAGNYIALLALSFGVGALQTVAFQLHQTMLLIKNFPHC
jgi:hypothetical protein